jgi:hypothetical protein
MKQIGGIVTAGTEVYAATQQRLDALNQVSNDTVKQTVTATNPALPALGTNKLPSWVIPAAVGAGVLILILVVRKVR